MMPFSPFSAGGPSIPWETGHISGLSILVQKLLGLINSNKYAVILTSGPGAP